MKAAGSVRSTPTLGLVAAVTLVALLVCAVASPAYGQVNLTDERIRGQVQSLLGRDIRFADQNISVFVDNGEVMLRGTVDSPALRRAAAQIALSVRRVRHVYAFLRVKPAEVKDAELAKNVRAALARSASLAAFGLSADVRSQVVVLTGTVPSPAYRRAAEYIVADVRGVQDIVNKIEVVVSEKRSDDDILKDVLFVLGCDSQFPEQCPIIPRASQGVVILRGQVSTARERQRAVVLVELLKGVESVVDLIEVVPETEVPPELQGPFAKPEKPVTESE